MEYARSSASSQERQVCMRLLPERKVASYIDECYQRVGSDTISDEIGSGYLRQLRYRMTASRAACTKPSMQYALVMCSHCSLEMLAPTFVLEKCKLATVLGERWLRAQLLYTTPLYFSRDY